LQQDIVRHFIDAATPQECFVAVSELLGAGRVTEFQSSLERSKKARTTATNQRQQELRSNLVRHAMLDGHIADLVSCTAEISKQPISIEDWNKWREDLAEIGLKSGRMDFASREAPIAINSAIKQLDARRLISERQAQTLNSLLADIRGLAKQFRLDVIPLERTFIEGETRYQILELDLAGRRVARSGKPIAQTQTLFQINVARAKAKRRGVRIYLA
jgi:hypothetical protein